MAAAAALLVALFVHGIAAKCSTGFSVVAPEVAVPGKTTAVLVTLHGREGDREPLNVTVRLDTQDPDNNVKQLTTASQMITGYGIIPLRIPPSPSTHCTLHTSVGCVGDEDCTSRSHSTIRLLGPVRDVIVRPARHLYRPGEIITFWVLALDHDLRLVRGEVADVSLSDPAGTKVAVWHQLSLEEGVRKLSTSLAAGVRAGTWRIEAHCGGATSKVELEVNPSTDGATTAAPAGEQHYVELRFADSMRRRYKPGLPFVGRVEAMSTERQVRVRVKLYDDKTDIYSQDIDMSAGEGGFVVPTVMADAEYINLQAELVAVEGKEIETHYVLARERIRRWNSTAKCYLLIENLPTPLQVGNVASATVWSSCGCRERLLAAVTSGGRAVHWAVVPAPNDTNTDLCKFNYTFPVSADMAPVSSLLVYYVTDAGEPVSDVADFHVKLLHKEVAIAVEERRWWYPRAALQLRVLAPVDSTMCLIGARAPPDSRFDPHQTTPDHEEHPPPEFVSAGVSLFVGGGACGGGVLYRQRTAPPAPAPAHLVPPASHDRLWMWKCFNYTSQLSTDGVTISAPSEAGRWSLWALSLSNRGLRFSSPKTINVFRPIQLDFAMPPALKVGETVEVDVKITNNINSCMDVTALLALSAGARFASTGALYVTERLRLGPRGGTQLVVKVAVDSAGRKNITVEVTGYSADNCSVSYTSFNNETLVGSVVRSASVLVLPEGLHRSETQSAYFCANEHIAVSSRTSYDWQWVAAPRNKAGLVLELKSQGAAHIALSAVEGPSDDMYRVVFEKNRVWIARGRHGYDVHLASAEQTDTDGECSSTIWCARWVSWDGGRLSVGMGGVTSERRQLVWPMAKDMKVNFVGFSSLWGDRADFRIWNFNDEAGFSQVLELSLPHGVVPGSALGNLLISGGLHLPTYTTGTEASESWSSVWKDSQMFGVVAGMAPLLALEYLPHLVEDKEKERILRRLPEQVQILLSFKKPDNSFSDHPSLSSHLSTVQVLEVLTKVQSYYPIDPQLLQSIKKWIQNRQNKDGSFTPLTLDKEIDYYPIDLKKLNGSRKFTNEYYYYDKDNNMTKDETERERRVEVTAETLSTLLEVGVENQKDADVVTKAQKYLEGNYKNLTSPAVLAATVLALVLSRSPLVPDALVLLNNASTTEEGEFGWDWPPPRRDAADWLLEDNTRSIKTTTYEAVSLEQYTAAVRVLLSSAALGALRRGEAAARYLYYRAPALPAHPRHAYIATKAAARYAQLAHDKYRSLTISLATAGMELTDTLQLTSRSPQAKLALPGLPTKVFVYATGAGCATLQGTTSYSTYTPKPENSLLSVHSAIIEEIRAERSSLEDLQGTLPTLNVKTCFRWKSKNRSNLLRLEISLFSGYELHSVNPVVLDGQTFADLHYGSRGESLWFLFANISSECPVCVTYQVKSKFVVSGLRPAYARIYPSTRPDLAVETFFHGRPGSPLLTSITDDDFITWFDKTQLASLQSTSDIDNICECGSICNENNEKRNTEPITNNDKTNKSVNVASTKKYKTSKTVASTLPTFTIIAEESSENTHEDFTVSPNATERTDDPIIIPTVVYKNNNHSNTDDNNLVPHVPKSTGNLIVQKLTRTKPVEAAKKVYPRKKGTLKSTYGDKHDLILASLVNETKLNSISVKKSLLHKETILNDKVPPPAIVKSDNVNPIKPKVNTTIASTEMPQEKGTKKLKSATSSSKPIDHKLDKKPTAVMPEITNQITKKRVFKATTKVNEENKRLTQAPIPTKDITSEEIVTPATNFNEQYFIRTKKPMEATQIKKPKIELKTTNKTSIINKTAKPKDEKNNLTKDKNIMKHVKSVNKEKHKIPSVPVSETSKIIIQKENAKSGTLNEDKVIEKNSLPTQNYLWDLLKEGKREEPTKVESLGIHKMNMTKEESKLNNRSL